MVSSPPLSRLSVAEAVERYLRGVQRAVSGHSLAATTAQNYQRDLHEFVHLAGADTVLDDLTAEAVDDIVLAYGDQPDGRYSSAASAVAAGAGAPGGGVKTRGQGAQARFRQSVSRLFSEATLEGWVEHNPMPRTKVRPKARGMSNAARKALPQSSAEALLQVPSREPARRGPVRTDMRLGLRDTFLLRLFMEAGPRVSEVCRADRADLEVRDDGTTWLRVLGKGSKERWLPLSRGTVDSYERYLEDERPEPRPRTRKDPATGDLVQTAPLEDAERALTLSWRGVRMQPRDMQLMVERACRNLPPEVRRDVTPHGLRHTAATLLLSSGAADIKTVKELLGHASIATTGVYLDTVADEMAQAVKAHPVTGDVARDRHRPAGSA